MFSNFWWFFMLNAYLAAGIVEGNPPSTKSYPSVGPKFFKSPGALNISKYCLTDDRVLVASTVETRINLKVLSLSFDLLSETNKTWEQGNDPSTVEIFTFECNSKGDFVLYYKLDCSPPSGLRKRKIPIGGPASFLKIFKSNQTNPDEGITESVGQVSDPASNTGAPILLLSDNGNVFIIKIDADCVNLEMLGENRISFKLLEFGVSVKSPKVSCIIGKSDEIFCAVGFETSIEVVEANSTQVVRSKNYWVGGSNGLTTEKPRTTEEITHTSISLHKDGDILVSANYHQSGGFVKISKDNFSIVMGVTITEYTNFIYPIRSLSDLSGNVYFLYKFFNSSSSEHELGLRKYSIEGKSLKNDTIGSVTEADSFFSNNRGNLLFRFQNSTDYFYTVIWNTSCPLDYEVNTEDNSCQKCGLNSKRQDLTQAKCEPLCDAGYEPSDGSCQKCDDGKYKVSVGNDSCSSCPANAVCSSSSFECDAGYEPSDGSCQKCDDGKYKVSVGNDYCVSCPDNAVCSSSSFECDAGYEPSDGSCQKCDDGKYKVSVGNDYCVSCPENSKCNTTSFTCYEKFYLDKDICSPVSDQSQAPLGPVNDPSESESSNLNKNSVIIIAGAGSLGFLCILSIIVFRRRSNRSKISPKALKEIRRNTLASIIGIKSSYKPVFNSASQSLVSISETLAENSEMSIPVFCRMIRKKDFDMEERIGNGGNGVIYDCSVLSDELYFRSNKQKLVFKYVGPSTDLWGEKRTKSFYQELGIMWKLRTSDQFVHVAGYCEKPAGIIMKKYIGGDLSNLIQAKTDIVCRFNYSKILVLNLMKQMAEAILFMHNFSLAHNDIKPQNVFLDVDASKTQLIAIIGDFGLCKVLDAESMRVPAFKVADVNGASVAYAAPESIRRIREKIEDVNPQLLKASDTYSLSMTFMEMIVRYVPWLYHIVEKSKK